MNTNSVMKSILIVSILLVAGSCQKPQAIEKPKPEFAFGSQIGIVVKGKTQTCLAIVNPSLTVGTKLSVVSLEPPQAVLMAEVVAAASDECKGVTAAELVGNFYTVRMVTGDIASFEPALAVYGYSGAFGKDGEMVTADLNSDGNKEYFRSCASSEGLHLTVWSGKPITGKRKWHEYYYLGYDIEPDCDPSDIPEQQ